MATYDYFLFDMYGTLIDLASNEDKDELWEKLSLFYSYNDAYYLKDDLRTSYLAEVKKELDQNTAFTKFPDVKIEKVFELLFKNKGITPSTELVIETCRIFRILSTEYIKLYDGVKETLEYLKAKGKKIYILSNGQRLFSLPELKYVGIDHLFDGLYWSSDIEICKPDTAFFTHLIKNEKLCLDKCIMIGNDDRTDIQGANNTFIDSVYIHSNHSRDIKEVDCKYKIWDGNFLEIKKLV